MEKEEKIYICPSCGKELWSFNMLVDLKRNYYNGDSGAVGILSEYASSRKKFPETYQLICLNEKCERTEKPIDKILLDLYENMKSMKDDHGNLNLDLSRSKSGKFESNK